MIPWFIDAHCHLDLIKDIQYNFKEEDALPIKTIAVTNTPSFFEHNKKLFKDAKNTRVAIGLHPELASQFSGEMELFKHLLKQTRYVGEIGLDGSDRFKSSFNKQVSIFKDILSSCAKEQGKVVSVHTRKAERESIQILIDHLKDSNCKVILHWFTGGDFEIIKKGIQAGFYWSINQKMMNTNKGQELIRIIPTDKLLTETDAPFALESKMSRLTSLANCVDQMSVILKLGSKELRETIFNNFKAILI